MAGGTASVAVAGMFSNAVDMNYLSGGFAEWGGSAGVVAVGGRDWAATKHGGETLWTDTYKGGLGFDVGIPLPAEIHAGGGGSLVIAVPIDDFSRWLSETFGL